MKAKITSTKWEKSYDTKYGELHLHRVQYDGKTAFYSSKKKDQQTFKVGQEAEFDEIEKTGKSGTYLTIKPINPFINKKTNYGKALQREQTKYSGFAVSYVKDLIIAGKVDLDEWKALSGEMCEFMFNLDKRMGQ